MQHVLLGLGANVGIREFFLQGAIDLLSEHEFISVDDCSSFIETSSWGRVPQPSFLNAALSCTTLLSVRELLQLTQKIEKQLGRKYKSELQPRCIDIDILFYGDHIICDEDLIVPHPLLHQREFVLQPLVEIAKDFVHPLLEKNIEALYNDLQVVNHGL
ncbi:MAG: 2-amino-4-hydroxy-6-hydroxymethyldihydropteridine diphosphokinase [bacterium]